MQYQQRKRIVQKLWGWICLSANCLVASLYLVGQHPELLGGGVLLSVLTVCYGAIKTHMDRLKGDASIASIVMEYVCVYVITFLLGVKVVSYRSSISVLVALVFASIAEMLVFLLITYWHTIRRFFKIKQRK